MSMHNFWAYIGPFSLKNFFWKTINIILPVPITLLISFGKIFKKSLEQIQNSQDVPFLRLEWPTAPNKNVLQKVKTNS